MIVIIDDDVVARFTLRTLLERAGYQTIEFEDGAAALAGLPHDVTAVCLDLGLGDMDGRDVLQRLRGLDPDLPVVVVTADEQRDSAVEVMRAGAWDYVVKPILEGRLLQVIERAAQRHQLAARVRSLSAALEEHRALAPLVGDSAAMQELRRQIQLVADSNVAVCVLGETGSGKELVARAIHEASSRASGPFVALNCGAIAASLQESELFGHERGAFTGANGVHRGRFEQANGGSLFLDELGEMAPGTQASLLRTLQERVIRRLGGTQDLPVDVRVISATHRDLEAAIAAGGFREDLYYRLVVYPIRVPALRERLDDVPLLAAAFLRRLAAESGLRTRRISPDAIEALMRYRWPGNVRELQNVVHRAVLACGGDEIQLAHLPPTIREAVLPPVPVPAPRIAESSPSPPARVTPTPTPTPTPATAAAPVQSMQEVERLQILRALSATNGNMTRAAKVLGIGRATLYRRLGELGLSSDLWRARTGGAPDSDDPNDL